MSEVKLPNAYGVYLITKVGFDNTENEIGSAIYKETIGVIKGTDKDIKEWVENNKPSATYKGWDGNDYPYYKATLLNVLMEVEVNYADY